MYYIITFVNLLTKSTLEYILWCTPSLNAYAIYEEPLCLILSNPEFVHQILTPRSDARLTASSPSPSPSGCCPTNIWPGCWMFIGQLIRILSDCHWKECYDMAPAASFHSASPRVATNFKPIVALYMLSQYLKGSLTLPVIKNYFKPNLKLYMDQIVQ